MNTMAAKSLQSIVISDPLRDPVDLAVISYQPAMWSRCPEDHQEMF